MSTEVTPANDVLIYKRLYTAPTVHIIDTQAPVLPDADPERPRAMCGVKPYWPGIWLEIDVEPSPICRNCEAAKEASFSA